MPDTALRFIGLTRKSKGEDDGTHIEQVEISLICVSSSQ